MAIKIMLDAGHYGKYNRSPVLRDYYESDMTWKYHLKLKKELESYGFIVLTTRADKDKDVALENRGKAAKGCDLFISLHSNGCDTESVDRVEVYYPVDGRNNSQELAKKFATGITSLMGVSGYKARTKENKDYPGTEYYGVMRGANKVNVPLYFIIEHSFHTNLKATKWLMDEANLDKLAELEAGIIAGWYGYKKAVPGDVNGDGKVNAVDYMMIKRYVESKLTEEQLKAADINNDGVVDEDDYIAVKNKTLKK